MKKIFTFISAVVMALSMVAANLDTIQVDGIYYQLNKDDQTATLIRYNTSSKYEIENIVIPVSVSKDEVSYPVIALGQGALRNSTAKTVVFAKGSKVTSLGMQFLQAAVDVLELELPEGVKTVPMTGIHNATAANPMKMKKLVLPASVDSIVRMAVCLPQLELLQFKGAIPPKMNTFLAGSGYTQNAWEVNKDNVCNTAKSAIVVVPVGAVEAYKSTAWIGDYFTTILAEKDTIEADGLYFELNNLAQTASLIAAQNTNKKYEQESIVIPVSVSKNEIVYPVVALARGAFKQSTAKSISFAAGSNVKEIGTQSFQRVINLKELELPEGIQLIPVTGIHSDQDPAVEPMALEKVILPASVDSLAMMSVVASGLKSIEFKGAVPPGCCHKYIAATDYYQVPWQINAVHKNFTSKECQIIVPDGALAAYKAAPGIGDYFTNIIEKKDVPTAIDQLSNDQKQMTSKVVRNGQILILRDGKTFTLTGQEVR